MKTEAQITVGPDADEQRAEYPIERSFSKIGNTAWLEDLPGEPGVTVSRERSVRANLEAKKLMMDRLDTAAYVSKLAVHKDTPFTQEHLELIAEALRQAFEAVLSYKV